MRPIQAMFAATIWIVLSSVADAGASQIPRECAMRDMRFLWQLEERGALPDARGDKLYDAFLTMLRARSACTAGQTAEAMALYDSAFGPFVTASPTALRPHR
jgi:hypothetical protein